VATRKSENGESYFRGKEALIAGVLGLSGVAGAATQIAWILFVVFMILFVVGLVMGRRPPV
jgi:uncharacterized membrane protein YtjA (UPF0391 family)